MEKKRKKGNKGEKEKGEKENREEGKKDKCKSIKGKIIWSLFPVYDYLAWNEKKTIEILLFTINPWTLIRWLLKNYAVPMLLVSAF